MEEGNQGNGVLRLHTIIDTTNSRKIFQQEADDGEWVPNSQEPIDEGSSHTASQESQESVDEEFVCAAFPESQHSVHEEYASQSSAAYSSSSDDEERVHGDESLMLQPGTGYPPKLTGQHVLSMAEAREVAIGKGLYGPVKIFLDKMSQRSASHRFSREQLTIIHKFIKEHPGLRDYQGNSTRREEARWEKKLRRRWDSLWEKYGDDARL